MHALGHLGDGLGDIVVVEVVLVVEVGSRVQRLALRKGHSPPLVEILAGSALDETVEVDCHHGLGTRSYGSSTHRVLVGGVVVGTVLPVLEVLEAVAQTAAAGKGIRAVGKVAEEAVSLGPHLSGEVGIIRVGEIVASVGEQCHGLHREGQKVIVALLVEPVHKVLLQPVEGLPFRSRSVREAEVTEHALEVVAVKVTYVPKNGLIATVACRHVHRVHNLLEVVVDDLHEGALLGIHFHDVVQVLEVIVTVVLADEIVQVHQELRSGHRSHELGGDGINEVDELAAERLEVGRCNGHAAQFLEAADEERVHRDGYTVREARRTALVVFIQDVRVQILEVLVGEGAAVQGLYLVAHDITVLLDVVLLVELVAQGHNVFAGDVGIGVELGSRCSIGGCDVVLDEVPLLAQVDVGIKLVDVCVGYALVDGHQRLLHLAADFSAGNSFIDIKVIDNRHYYRVVTVLLGRLVCFVNTSGKFGFVELLYGAVGLTYIHYILFLIILK